MKRGRSKEDERVLFLLKFFVKGVFGGCNEPCTARVTRRLRGNVSGQKR